MAFVTVWDINFNSKPLPTDVLGNGYSEIQQTRVAVAERIGNEHSFNLNDVSNTNHGRHLEGSARIYVSDSEPTNPAAPFSDSGDYEKGRVLYKPTAKELLIRIATGWISFLKVQADAIFNTLNVKGASLFEAQVSYSGTETHNGPVTFNNTVIVNGNEHFTNLPTVGASMVPLRGIIVSTSAPSGGDEGNIWIQV